MDWPGEGKERFHADCAVQGSHVLFLMNCHATPWQSHLHAPTIDLSFLDCSPPGYHAAVMQQNAAGSTGLVHVAQSPAAASEQATFFSDPQGHLCRMFGGCGGWTVGRVRGTRRPPTHLVMYDDLLPQVDAFVVAHSYQQVASFSWIPLDGSRVVVLAR